MESTDCKTSKDSSPAYKYFVTTVVLITAHSQEYGSNVMACEWTMNVRREPLCIMTVIKKNDLTHELIWTSGEFGVNLCSEQQSALSHLAGSKTGNGYNKLADPLFQNMTYSAQYIQTPMICDCVLNAECVVENKIDMHEYTAFIGRALKTSVRTDLRPLLYHQGSYVRLGDRIIKPEKVNM